MINLVTRQVPARYHNQSHNTVFDLEGNRVYSSDLRLVNLTGGQRQSFFNTVCGSLSLIKNIRLMDGNIVIDEFQMVNLWSAFQNLRHQNRNNRYFGNVLKRTDNGFFQYRWADTDVVDMDTSVSYTKGDSKGYLSLKDVLPYLAQTEQFRFKNPRLVIEWETDVANVFTAQQRANLPVVTAPELIVDEIVNPNAQNVSSQQVFRAIENDRLTLPAVAQGDTQDVRYRINAFNKKRCGRGLLVWQGSVNNDLVGTLDSVKSASEKYQFYVDDQPLLPSMEDSTTKQSRVNDIWGPLNIPIDFYSEKLNTDVLQVTGGDTRPKSLTGKTTLLQGEYSYGAINLGGMEFKNLEVHYTRSGVAAAQPRVTLRLFVEVVKVITYDADGNAVVSYSSERPTKSIIQGVCEC